MIVGSVSACSGFCGVAVLTFLRMSRQLPVTTAPHPASDKTPNFCQSPLFFCAQRLDHFRGYGVHSSQISSWKKQALTAIEGIFAGGGQHALADRQSEIDELHRQLGLLTAERDWLKKKSWHSR